MIEIDGTGLTLDDFRQVVDGATVCALSATARQRVEAKRG